MNERIRELADQAAITTNLETNYFEKDINKWVDYYSEKFAELIVRECAEFVRYKAEKSMSQEVLYVGNDLLTHFGVES